MGGQATSGASASNNFISAPTGDACSNADVSNTSSESATVDDGGVVTSGVWYCHDSSVNKQVQITHARQNPTAYLVIPDEEHENTNKQVHEAGTDEVAFVPGNKHGVNGQRTSLASHQRATLLTLSRRPMPGLQLTVVLTASTPTAPVSIMPTQLTTQTIMKDDTSASVTKGVPLEPRYGGEGHTPRTQIPTQSQKPWSPTQR
jgi:hypothetical protein